MSKGDNTREMIIERSAQLFNEKGYSGTSMSDIMEATNLKKGVIYNHFSNKEEIRLASFEYNFELTKKTVNEIIRAKPNSTEKLIAMFEFYRVYPLNPIISGGCPIINSIVDSNQSDIPLQESVQEAIDQLLGSLIRIIQNGIRYNEFKSTVNPETVAIYFYSMLQGGVLLTRGKNDRQCMNVICDQLILYVNEEMKI